MCGTRSPSLKAPVTEAILVSHGQPSDPLRGEERLSVLAQKVRIELPEWTIKSATLAAPKQLDAVLERAGPEPLIFPVFMTDGWFTKTMLPKRIGSRSVRQLAPLGVHPELPRRTAELLHNHARQLDWEMDECEVLLTAHGSATGPAAAKCVMRFVEQLKRHLRIKTIRTGFLEQDPGILKVARKCELKTLELPFFAASGGHTVVDVPSLLDQADFTGLRLPPLGEAEFVPTLIGQSLRCGSLRSIAA